MRRFSDGCGGVLLWLLCCAHCVLSDTGASALCATQKYYIGQERSGGDYANFVMSPNASTAKPDDLAVQCRARCCADGRCKSWGISLRSPANYLNCTVGSTCCWLKGVASKQAPCGGSYGCITGLGNPTPYRFLGTPPGVNESFDCEARRHALEFAKHTLPGRGEFKSLFDALQMQHCPGLEPPTDSDAYIPPRISTPAGAVFVDPNVADVGGADGSRSRPFGTIQAALNATVRVLPGSNTTIVLRGGVHYIVDQLLITPMHSNLAIQNFEGERAIVSGAIPIRNVSLHRWSLYNATTNTWRLDLEGLVVTPPSSVLGMRLGNRRSVRARYPNGNLHDGAANVGLSGEPLKLFERGPPTGKGGFGPASTPLSGSATFETRPADWPGVFWLDEPEGGNLPYAGENMAGTGAWMSAYGELCSDRQAPYGFWCTDQNPRSQIPGDYCPGYFMPAGSNLSGTQLQSRIANWSSPQGAVYHLRTNYFSAQCLVDSYDNASGRVHFHPHIGCDQGAVPPMSGFGMGWYVDNVLEECDAAGEFFFDAAAEALYYTFNVSERPKGNENISLVVAKVIFNISGTQTMPVRDVTIRGLTVQDAALTYLGTTSADIHYQASSTDWAIQRSAAVFVEGTEDFRFEANHVTDCDGNGLFLSNYNRRAQILGNEFSWLGDNAMAAFGSMSECLYQNCSVRLPFPSGLDGRPGNQPRDTLVAGNLVREVGLYQRQSSAWSQQLTASTRLLSNVFFNGPHAAASFNDGFGGGDTIAGNMMVNFCRTTFYGHGLVNVWCEEQHCLGPIFPSLSSHFDCVVNCMETNGLVRERAPYIYDRGLVRNYSKAIANDTDMRHVVTVSELESGFSPGFSPAPPGVGSVVSPFRRIHHNLLIANYEADSAVVLDDGASRTLMWSNYMLYGMSGAGESCHNSQWVFGVGNLYAYTTQDYLLGTEGMSPLGVRTAYNNNTFLLLKDTDWCRLNPTLNLSQFWDNRLHAPGGEIHILPPYKQCNGGDNKVFGPMTDANVTLLAKALLSPYPLATASPQ